MNIELIKYIKKPNTIDKGTLYIGEVDIKTLKKEPKRNIRIYLPSNYDDKKRFPVIYMMDGKNLFDKYTSFAGEWGIDEIIEERVKNNEQAYIIVGIDSAKDGFVRIEEMLPNNKNLAYNSEISCNVDSYGEILAQWIVEELKPFIDKTFKTITDTSSTAIAGSSMGGLFSFYLGYKYQDIFGMMFSFSPAFCLYQEKYYADELSKLQITNHNQKLYLLVGDIEYENQFVSLTKHTYEQLKDKLTNNIRYVHDKEGIHHETFWNKYFNDAIKYWENNN